MSLLDAAISALAQLTLLGGVPFVAYAVYQKWRQGRGWSEIAKRAGLQGCSRRYLLYSVVLALIGVLAIVVWSPQIDLVTREGSAQRQFVGLGPNGSAFLLAFFYGVVQTGLTEELLFRGLIAGSLSRRLSVFWANAAQAFVFFLPHLLIFYVMPEAWALLPLVFVGALAFGWLRIKSGSIIGPWLMHASVNVAMALSVAIRTATLTV
jgi:membrane protease YdiL (CAAX protease family)